MRATLLASIVLVVALAQLGSGAEPLDKVERAILKQPQYVSDRPLYGLVAFGPDAKTKAWAVFDRSPNSEKYDVVYFDRNANGDLTDAGERIEGQPEADSKRVIFDVGAFTDAETSEKHTEFKFIIETSDGPVEHPLLVEVELKWNGEHRVASNYPTRIGAMWRKQSPMWNFAESIQTAPVFWFGGSAPLTFNGWGIKPLAIDRMQRIPVTLGHAGIGDYSFSAVLSDFVPKNVPVHFSLRYTATNGEQKESTQESVKRFSGVFYSAFMRIPADAQPGMATVRCSLPARSGLACAPIELPVELVRPTAETLDDNDPAPYDENAVPSQQIASALGEAKTANKIVLLQFGFNGCLWCKWLHDLFATDKEIREQLNNNYIEVLIDINDLDPAIDEKYGVSANRTFPFIVLLDGEGKMLTTQKPSEWEAGDEYNREKVLAFLKQWTPKK